MKYALVTLGTRGDLQPYLALALGLQAQGQDPLIVSAQNDQLLVEGLGLKHWPLSIDIQAALQSPEVQAMTQSDNPLKFFRSHLRGMGKLREQMARVQAEIFQACQGQDALIYHPGQQGVYLIGQQLGIPTILASPFPLTETGRYPALLFYAGPRLGSVYNRLTHRVFQTLFWWMARSSTQAFWRPQKVPLGALSARQERSGMPVLYGYSPLLFPRPPEWSDNIQVTGAWHLEQEPYWSPSPELQAFLESGPPPVYVGFGSMKEKASFEPMLDLLIQSASLSGQRMIVSLGWNQPPDERTLPPEVFLLGNASHAWLFPQMAALVHHGGAGTVAAGLRAGRATLVIPHMADQPGWGRRIQELGLGPKPLPKSRLTAPRLAESIAKALDPTVQERAREIGHQMAQEKGVAGAVALLRARLGSR